MKSPRKKGAAAAIIIHETVPAAYPYAVVRTSWAKENFELDAPDKNMGAVQVRSWITLDVAKKLLADCGQDFDALKKAALTKTFKPVPLKRESEHRHQTSVALIQIAQRHRQARRQRSEIEKTNTSFIPRTGIILAVIPSCKAIRFSTARSTMLPATRR